MRSDSKTLLTTINTLRGLLAPTMVTSRREAACIRDRTYRCNVDNNCQWDSNSIGTLAMQDVCRSLIKFPGDLVEPTKMRIRWNYYSNENPETVRLPDAALSAHQWCAGVSKKCKSWDKDYSPETLRFSYEQRVCFRESKDCRDGEQYDDFVIANRGSRHRRRRRLVT